MLRALLLLYVPVAIGSAVMLAGAAPGQMWAAHAAMGLVGVMGSVLAARGPRLSERAVAMQLALAAVTIAATLFVPGIEGVQRWLTLGLLRVNPSALLAPALLAVGAAYARRRARDVAGYAVMLQLVHVLQPDAGQATAWAAAVSVLLLSWKGKLERERIFAVVLVLGGAIAAWLRADPLAGAAFVEDIVPRAFGVRTWVGCLAIASMAGAVLAFALLPTKSNADVDLEAVRRAEVTLGVYLATAFAVSALGEFPVPLLGFGMSATVGPFLGLSVLRRSKGW